MAGGHQPAGATAITCLRNRFYSPDLGRFISSDPLGLVDGPNTYGFCGGDPVNRMDPMGLGWHTIGGERVWIDEGEGPNPTVPEPELTIEEALAKPKWGLSDAEKLGLTGHQAKALLRSMGKPVATPTDIWEFNKEWEGHARTDAEKAAHRSILDTPSSWQNLADQRNIKNAKFELFKLKNQGANIYSKVIGPASELLLMSGDIPVIAAAGIRSAFKLANPAGQELVTALREARIAGNELRRLETALTSGAVRVFRVEGLPNARLLIDEMGQVVIMDKGKTLWLNFGNRARAEEFLAQRMAQSQNEWVIKSFSVPQKVLDDLRKAAVLESEVKLKPNAPIIGDPTKAPDQFGLRPQDIENLENAIIQGTGKVEQ